jgi:hypothetical protein
VGEEEAAAAVVAAAAAAAGDDVMITVPSKLTIPTEKMVRPPVAVAAPVKPVLQEAPGKPALEGAAAARPPLRNGPTSSDEMLKPMVEPALPPVGRPVPVQPTMPKLEQAQKPQTAERPKLRQTNQASFVN